MNRFILFAFFIFGLSLSAFAQPANNTCTGALDITGLFSSGCATVGAGASPATHANLPIATNGATSSGQNNSCMGTVGDDMWFTWTATQTSLVWQYLSTGGDPGIAVFSGTCGSLIEVDCFTTFSAGTLSGWNVGDELFILIHDFTNSADVDLAFCLEVPGNSICDANPLTVNSGYCDGTNVNATNNNATADGTAGSCFVDGAVNNNVWYSVIVPSNVSDLTFSTDFAGGTNTDTQIAVYSSNNNDCTGTLTQVACDDDSGGPNGGPNFSSVASITDFIAAGVSAGDVLFIQVDGYNGTEGTFCIEVTGTFACSNPIVSVSTSCQLGDETNFYITLDISDFGTDNTAYSLNIGGALPNITTTGQYTYGPFTSGTPIDVTLTGIDITSCGFSQTGIDFDCSCDPSLLDAGIDATICSGESHDLNATINPPINITYIVSNPSSCSVATPDGATNTLSLGDDSGSGAIAIGFTFPFFNINYTDIYVSSNGYVTFSGTDQTDLSEDQIPSPTDPDAIIALFWDDLNPTTAGTISTFSSTIGGQTCFVVDYNGVAHFGGGDFVTGQIIICQDGSITINCIDCQVDGGSDNATQGIENETGTVGYFDAASTNGQFNSDVSNCVLFTPEKCDFVRWSADLSDPVGSSIATTEMTSVSPIITTTYYAIIDCDGLLCADEVEITVNPLPDLSVISPITNSCPSVTIDLTNTTITGLSDANNTTGTISYHSVSNPANASDQTVGTPNAVGAGTYYIRKETSTGCIGIVPITVNLVTCCDITINSLTPTNESCFQLEDGSIAVMATCNSCTLSTDIRYSIAPDPNSVSPQSSSTFSNLPPNNYTITVFDVNDNTCSENGNSTITAASEIMLNANGNGPICEGSNIELMAIFTANGTSTSAASWSWAGPSFTSSMEDPTPFASALANSGAFNVTVTDNNNCTASETVNILVDEMASVDLSSINTNLCYKLGTEMIDLSSDYISGSTNMGTWTTSGDGIFDDASNVHPTVTAYNTGVQDRSEATVTLTLTADPANACPVADDNISININDVSCTNTTPFSGNNN